MDNGSLYYQKFIEGDQDAMGYLVKEYRDGLILFINSYVKNITVSEDLAEDTFVKLVVRQPRDNRNASFKTWLYTIGKNIAIDYIRKNGRVKIEAIDDHIDSLNDSTNLEREIIKEEEKLELHKALGNIKDEFRQVLLLSYFEDLSTKEISLIIGKSVHATEMVLTRARQSLKEELLKGGFKYENI